MTPARPEALPRGWKAAIVAAATVAFIFKIFLALTTYGTNDVYAWERFARWSALFGSRLYTIDAAFNHPPSMIHVLAAMMWLAKTTGIAFPFWLRLPAILTDTASLWVVSRIFADRLSEPTVRWGLLLLALSPALILVSGFHGNTDPAVMFFVLLSVWLTQREGERDWQSGAAFGAAMCIKILPLIVLPALFFCRPELRRKAIFLIAAAVVMIVCWSPYVFRDPAGIVHQVLGYQSIYGHWGLSWLVCQFPWFRDSWHDAFQRYGSFVVLAVITLSAFVVNRSRTPASVYTQVGAALFFFLAVCSGFGVQYLAWLVPWTVGISIVPAAFFTIAGGAFLFLVYNWWAGGFPWYLADSNYVGDFTPHLNYFLTLCWISVIVLALAVWIRRPSFPSPRTRILLSVIAIAVFAYPLWNQLHNIDKRTYPPANDHAALVTIRAQEDAALSQVYYQMGRYTDAVVAARTGVALDPAVLDVWNNLALACIRLQRWDEALNAANNALRLAPNDETANANLAELLNRQ
jgi:Glycosyltransferase family 87/Tetratricopeptide repeat